MLIYINMIFYFIFYYKPKKKATRKTDIGISLTAKESVVFIEGNGLSLANFEDGHIEIRGIISSIAF